MFCVIKLVELFSLSRVFFTFAANPWCEHQSMRRMQFTSVSVATLVTLKSACCVGVNSSLEFSGIL